MEIKVVLLHLKKSFDRIILIGMALILIVCISQYLTLIRGKSAPFGEKELYKLIGAPWQKDTDIVGEDTFRELLDRKINFILGIKPAISYNRLIHRNPFVPLKDLVIKPFALKPATLKIGVGENTSFQTLYGIGPYTWKCEPDDLGTFGDNTFEAVTHGGGKIIATDARGETAVAVIEIIETRRRAAPKPPPDKRVNFKYKGPMKIVTPSGAEFLAVIKDLSTGRMEFKKSGEELGGFIIKEITQETLKVFDKEKGKEIELRRE